MSTVRIRQQKFVKGCLGEGDGDGVDVDVGGGGGGRGGVGACGRDGRASQIS